MGKPTFNILRTVRLQLKSGYLRHEPPSFTFMKRYPPLSRDTAPPVRKVDVRSIPYMKLYEDAVEKNPIYADEKVYPAYWQQEPQALTLAKKQYELMKAGMSEEAAYEEAVKYVEVLENKSFEEMKDLLENSGNHGAKRPFTSDPEVATMISTFRAKLQETPYDELDLADQGEIDFIIQTKILKWKEVERERRMKDPVFAMQFERLRASIFPEIAIVSSEQEQSSRDQFKSKLFEIFGVNKSRLCTAAPFFYEEYAVFFGKLKSEPLLGRWSERDRELLSRWIVDTLAVREIVDKGATAKVQRYLDALRAQFFPMVRYPDRVSSFVLPSQDEFKKLLYTNDVGYKRIEGKLYVRRVHRIPMLLFPKETFTTNLLMDGEKLKTIVDDENSLLKEVMSAGLDEASVPELQKQLREYMSGSQTVSSDYGVRGGQSGTVDMSSLDDLLRDMDGDDHHDDFATSTGTDAAKAGAAGSGAGAEAVEDASAENRENSVFESDQGPVGMEEWKKVVERYVREPVTPLGKEREQLFGNMENTTYWDATYESELKALKRERLENELIVRARLSVAYEQKEAARRSREWRQRGVWIDKLPAPSLELVDERS